MKHHPDDLIMLFNDLFRDQWRTILVRGGEEPEYIPARDENDVHRVIFAHGYFASALHEVSHWCIAGEKRRQLYDYGYWYCADGRTETEQAAFEQVEVKPQALEWLFSAAAGVPFTISIDNLSGGGASDEASFRASVACQARDYLARGLPQRARLFLDTLLIFYNRRAVFDLQLFKA
ncbi:elongation factor P hydroxylase [Marinobacter fonticola]|uniref:elongation factor P hydroxylase n=1 Tax=Marinobacter fonticola TaxID=2603215 RepID=UPI00143DFD39|nr:elongation factor P hydroxylase [Marinobacter fonticola]